jgi:succinate dehydrogenase / fumarate reductase flavoprotein subunit
MKNGMSRPYWSNRAVVAASWPGIWSHGGLQALHAKAVILATGGSGRVFSTSTNAVINTGDGMALAYRAGLPLEDMEFVQFHPTTLKDTGILITEGARGEGGYLLNTLGERFMKQYAPEQMELATRSTVSLAIGREIQEGRGVDGCVLLDLRHLGRARILERLPQIRELALEFAGLDPIETPIPIRPGAHYQMGGVRTNAWGETDLPGLFAAGECACVSVHGANRLGGNSPARNYCLWSPRRRKSRRVDPRSCPAGRSGGNPGSRRTASEHPPDQSRPRTGLADPG